MTAHSKILDLLPPNYGYVVLTGVGSALVNMWMAMNVGKARKRFEVPYPLMYSPDSTEFNCIQRAHQHTLENYPQFLFLLLIGGLQYPVISSAAGSLYILGRILFAKGYYSGDPSKRKRGTIGYIGVLGLLGTTVSMAVMQLGWCPV